MSVEDQLNFQELSLGSANSHNHLCFKRRTVGFLSAEIRKDKEEGTNPFSVVV